LIPKIRHRFCNQPLGRIASYKILWILHDREYKTLLIAFHIFLGYAFYADNTEHVPLTHPQLPAPQSTSSHGSWYALLTHALGWQHWAGTQSESVSHDWTLTGHGANSQLGGILPTNDPSGHILASMVQATCDGL
jgi:hypothetical protein